MNSTKTTNIRYRVTALVAALLSGGVACGDESKPAPAVDETAGSGGGKADDPGGTESTSVVDFRVTVLETMVADDLITGFGWASLVEILYVDGTTVRYLVDAGTRAETVEFNAINIPVSTGAPYAPLDEDEDFSYAGDRELTFFDALMRTETIVLTHSHFDHIDGWIGRTGENGTSDSGLLQSVNKARCEQANVCDNAALTQLWVAEGFDRKRVKMKREEGEPPPTAEEFADADDTNAGNKLLARLPELTEKFPIEIHEVGEDTALGADVFVTGPVARTAFPEEKNYPPSLFWRQQDDEVVVDEIPDDQALVIRTSKGLVVITGCGHSGVRNIADQVASTDMYGKGDGNAIYAIIGGFHLVGATFADVEQTGRDLRKQYGVEIILAGHCSLVNPVFPLRYGFWLADDDHDAHPEGSQELDESVTVAAIGNSVTLDGLQIQAWINSPMAK